jgi:hypothetical protein
MLHSFILHSFTLIFNLVFLLSFSLVLVADDLVVAVGDGTTMEIQSV